MIRRLVISAVRPTDGGTLKVLQDFVHAACDTLPAEWDIVVFANSRLLFSTTRPTFIEFPDAKRSWLRRIWTEYVTFRRYARELAPDLWLSMHDVSPNVGSIRQAVYCHNPNPFFSTSISDVLFQPTQLVFRLFYSWLYRVNLRRNCAIVVQQAWLRERFRKWTSESQKIVVAHPSPHSDSCGNSPKRSPHRGGPATFIYPSLSRPFKNFEVVGRAVTRLERDPNWVSRVVFTLDGTENRYAEWLKRTFGSCASLDFIGYQSREQMDQLYQQADCLLFPSRMETWGLPISEAQRFRLPMLVADLPYAHETVGRYGQVLFIDQEDPVSLAQKMLAFQQGALAFDCARGVTPAQPFARDWPELVRLLAQMAVEET